MGFCEHCEGQRFDRAQVLRVLRATRLQLRGQRRVTTAEDVLAMAINAVRHMDVEVGKSITVEFPANRLFVFPPDGSIS